MTKQQQLKKIDKSLDDYTKDFLTDKDQEVLGAVRLIQEDIRRRVEAFEEEKRRKAEEEKRRKAEEKKQKAEEEKKRKAEEKKQKAEEEKRRKEEEKKQKALEKKEAVSVKTEAALPDQTAQLVPKEKKPKKTPAKKQNLAELYDLIDQGDLEGAFRGSNAKEAQFFQQYLQDREAILNDRKFPAEYDKVLTANGMKLMLYIYTGDRQNNAAKASATKTVASDALKHAVLMERRRKGMRIEF